MTPPAKARPIFLSAIIFLCLFVAATFLSFYYFRRSERWVSHTQEVRAVVGELDSTLNYAARARMNYILSGNSDDLKDFRATLALLPQRLAYLRQLTNDNALQHQRADQVEAIVQKRLQIWDDAISERQQGHTVDPAVLLTQNLQLSRQTAEAIDELRTEEGNLLVERTHTAHQRFLIANAIVAVSFLLCLALLLYYYYLLSRELQLREAAEAGVREAYAREVALRHQEQRFRLFIDAVREYAIFTLDARGHVSSWNEGAARLNGFTAGEILGKHFSQFFSAEDIQDKKPEKELEAATREGRVEEEGWRIRKDGSLFWANIVVTAIRDQSGELIGFVKVTRDFTERMRAQEMLRRANRELMTEIAERKLAESRLASSETSLRELSRHLLRTQDEERRRIGRDLHDSLGQILAVLKMNLDSLESVMGTNHNGLVQMVTPCIRLCEDALREVRTISYLLYPPMLEEMGLKSAIPWYLGGFSKRSNIETSLDIDPEFDRLPLETELAFFRILQEALTNVHRHSGSSTASIRLSLRDGKAILEVSDQGKGMQTKLLEKSGEDRMGSLGVGLRGMNERLRQLGGKLEVSSNENGTTINAIVPVETVEGVSGLTRTA